MIPVTALSGKNVALFGLGGSGLATAQALAAGGAKVVAYDDNPQSVTKAAQAGIATADLRTIDWTSIASLVLSPGVPLTHPKPHWSVDLARNAGVEVIGDVELFCRERNARAPTAPFIAITGTNGKSTTTALISHVLAAAGIDTQMGGNIGRAILTLDPPEPTRAYVVECSSYQIDLAPSLNPSAGILLNLTPDHLDRHGTMQHYAAIKERLVAGSDVAIVAIDDSWSSAVADRIERAGGKVIRISKRLAVADGYFADGPRLLEARNGKVNRLATLEGIGSLRGQHNAQNALAALAAARVVGLDLDAIQRGFDTFPGLAHRMEQVGHLGEVLFVNDSKATNAEAAAPALSSFPRIHWILGGLPKEGGIASLSNYFPKIAKAYLIGEAAPSFAATLGETVPYEISGTLENAVKSAARDAVAEGAAEGVVLLSPACASFDQFRNFEERGTAFRTAVLALEGIKPIGGAS